MINEHQRRKIGICLEIETLIKNYENMKENANNTKSKYSQFKILYGDDLPFHHLYSPRENIYRKACKIKDIDFEEINSNPIPPKMNGSIFKT
jgi:hypothetical protein